MKKLATLTILSGTVFGLAKLVSHNHDVQFALRDWLPWQYNGPARLSRDGEGVLVLSGVISQGTSKPFFANLQEGDRSIRLRSGGGEVREALEIGREIRRRGFEVIVDGLCASACANFLFPAGLTQRVVPGGLLVMHGGGKNDLHPLVRERFPAASSSFASMRVELMKTHAASKHSEMNQPGESVAKYYVDLGLDRRLLDASTAISLEGISQELSIVHKWTPGENGRVTHTMTSKATGSVATTSTTPIYQYAPPGGRLASHRSHRNQRILVSD